MKSVATHLRDFLLAHPGPVFAMYRRRAAEQIARDYGPQVWGEVRELVERSWPGPDRAFCPPGNPACSSCPGCPGGKAGTGRRP